jgi:DNA-binding NarL/FixJ family response regulator
LRCIQTKEEEVIYLVMTGFPLILRIARGDKPMSNSNTNVPSVRVFVATAGGIGCQIMAESLGRSGCGLSVVGYACNLMGIRMAVKEDLVDVALIDSHLKDGSKAGFDATRSIRASNPKVRVIMMLDASERSLTVDVFRAGASGIFSHDDSFDLLCKCIRAVHDGQVWANSKQLQSLIHALAQAQPAQATKGLGPNGLTNREQAVVQLVAEGMTNRDISRELNLSENTVRNYLFRIFNKVGSSNRMELARYAWDQEEAKGQRTPAVVE